MKKARKANKRLVRLKDAAHILAVPPLALDAIVLEAGFQVVEDSSYPCISFAEFEALHNNPKVAQAAERAALSEAKRRQMDELSGVNDSYWLEIQEKIAEYRGYVGVLERIHSKYRSNVPIGREESALVAAYLLFSRVINLLNMGIVCLEASYWNAGTVLRQIDETVDLAEYYSHGKATEQIALDILRWFRENRSPKPSHVRKELAEIMRGVLGQGEGDRHIQVMDELYESKSKWIHPTLSPIRETMRTSFSGNQVFIDGFDYGPCTYPRKIHELTLFFRSSIWTAVTGFLMCFSRQIPLDPEDANELFLLDRKFQQEPDGL